MFACLGQGQAVAGGDVGYGYKQAPVTTGRTIWEGFHVGAHAGWADVDYGVSQTLPVSPLVTTRDSQDSFVGGFTYGSSWQFGNMVVGTDSAYTFGDLESGLNVAANGSSATVDFKYKSESRLRAGLLVNPNILVYGTVGIALADAEVSGTLVGGGKDDDLLFGVAYGGGIETTMGSRWFARLEYIHIDYDDEGFREVGGGSFDVDADTDIIRGAIGYRFDWSPFDLLK